MLPVPELLVFFLYHLTWLGNFVQLLINAIHIYIYLYGILGYYVLALKKTKNKKCQCLVTYSKRLAAGNYPDLQ